MTGAAKGWKKRERKMAEMWIPENAGDAVEGMVQNDIHKINTKLGEADVVTVGDKAVIISAGLQDLKDLVGAEVRIVYQGEEKNPKTKRTYKAYDIYVPEDYQS